MPEANGQFRRVDLSADFQRLPKLNRSRENPLLETGRSPVGESSCATLPSGPVLPQRLGSSPRHASQGASGHVAKPSERAMSGPEARSAARDNFDSRTPIRESQLEIKRITRTFASIRRTI